MGIFDGWHGSRASAASPQDRQRIDETVERVVQTTNPKLRFARRYRARLEPAVATSLAYVRELVASQPAVREASAAAWPNDPYLRAFFATAEELVLAFSRSPELREFFKRNAGMPEAFATLGMAMTERRVLGMVADADKTRSEVAQTVVSFGDHRVRMCGRTEPELKAEIERRLVDQLALEALARIAADESRRTALEQERALVKVRLQLLERQGAGMGVVLGGEVVAQDELARLKTQFEENTRNLGDLGGRAEALDRELEHLCAVLGEPASHLYVSSKRLRLDAMNVVIEDRSSQAGTEFEFLQVRVPGTTPEQFRAFAFVRIARTELLSAGRLLDEAQKRLA
jgi:hypothetical protein